MRGKPGKIAAILLVGALGCGGLQLEATWRARDALARLLAAHPDLTVADVVAEPLAGRLRLRGVSLHGVSTGRAGPIPWRVTIGTLRLPVAGWAVPSAVDAAAAAPANAASPMAVPTTGNGTASVENVLVVSGTTTIRIKRIDMTGTTLTSADLAALLDAKGAATMEARLRRLSAAAIVVPEIVSDDATPGSERHATLTQVLLAGVSAGRVAAGSASGASFAIKDATDAVNGKVGTMEATGVDLGQIAHVFGSVRTNDAEPILPLYDSASLNGVTITNTTKHATLTVASIQQAGTKARALKTDLVAAAPKSAPGSAPGSAPESAALVDDVAHSLSFGSLVLNDLASRNEAPDGTTEFGVLRASVTDFGDGKVGGADVRSFRFQGVKQGKVAVDTLAVGPVRLPTEGADAMVPSAGTIDATGIDVDLVGRKPDDDADDAPAGAVKFKVGHMVVTSDGAGRRIPKTSTVKVDGVSFDAAPDGGLPLYDMGYRHLAMSGAGQSTYDAASRTLTINKLRIQGDDMGTLDLGLTLGNVGDAILSPDPQIAQAAMLTTVAKSVDLKIVNGGLFDRAIAWKAKKDGLSVEQERDTGVDFFTNGVPALVNDNPKVKALGAAVAGFIADPKALDLSIASTDGVGIAALGLLGTPDALIDGLDIKASTHP